jgi:branched-chain amino acid transport system ATP-binding protein
MEDPSWFGLSNLSVRYGSVPALKGISLVAGQGAIVTLIGANGAGKSTTLRAISGLVRPCGGEIFMKGRRIDGLSPQEIVRAGIAHVPEGRRVFPHMSVKENLMLGAFRRKDRCGIGEDLTGVLDRFPILKSRSGQKAGSLSGGEQQMLAVGRALMSSPELLLLDEPSMGLAPLVVRELGHFMTDINRRGVAILIVEQNANMALRLAHRAYVMELGVITLEGDARELIGNDHVKRAYLGG